MNEMKRVFAALIALMMLCLNSAAFAQTVVFENLHYGEEALNMHINEQENLIVFEGNEYSLNDYGASYESKVEEVWGGKTRAVHELTIPSGHYSVEDNGEETVLGEWVINIPVRAQLWVAQGNRISGEYVLEGPIDLTQPYIETVTLPRDENGHPLLVDKIYLYSFEMNGETQRYAASLYIDYDGYLAGRPVVVPAAPEEEAAEESSENSKALGMGAGAAAAVLLVGGVAVIKRKKRKAGQLKLVITAEDDLLAQGREMLALLKKESEGIKDEQVREKADTLCEMLAQQLDAAQENPRRLSGMRKMITYYLQVAVKVLAFWRSAEEQTLDEAKLAESRATTVNGLEMVIDAFRKKLNNMHDAEMMDISVELTALDQMLKREGLKDPRLKLTLNEIKKD